MKTTYFILITKLILIYAALFLQIAYCQQNSNIVNVKIYFDSQPSTTTLSKAVLKYNKDFAYSFTLDDGKQDSYSIVYPFFKGGVISGNGNSYPGLYYTDGCGNKIPFSAGVAITSLNANGDDTHVNNPSNITWTQLLEMYNSGWSVFNHSYTHSAGTGTNYNFEISENVKYVKEKTGIDLTHFVVPSGDVNYIDPAFNLGMKGVYDQKGFPGSSGFKVDEPIVLNRFGVIRKLIDDDNYNSSVAASTIDEIAGKSIGGNHYWYNDFTHKVTLTPMPAGFLFSNFEYYMEYIENTYGAEGSDRIWMTPLQEVYEYLVVRDKVIVSQSLNGNVLDINLDFTNVPSDLRKYALTLLIDSDQNFSNVESKGVSTLSFNGTVQRKLVNLDWNEFPNQSVNGLNSPTFVENNCPVESILIYPNPVEQGIIKVKSDTKDDLLTFTLYSQTGGEYSLGKHKNSNLGILELNIQQMKLPSGLYYLEVISEAEKCRRFIEVIKH